MRWNNMKDILKIAFVHNKISNAFNHKQFHSKKIFKQYKSV